MEAEAPLRFEAEGRVCDSVLQSAFGEHMTSEVEYKTNELLLKASVYNMFLSARAQVEARDG